MKESVSKIKKFFCQPKIIIALLIILILIILLVNLMNNFYEKPSFNSDMNIRKNSGDINQMPLVDDKTVYKNDNDKVEDIYITVVDKQNSDEKNTLDQVNSFNYNDSVDPPKVDVIFQDGDENSPFNTIGSYKENAKLEARGKTSQESKQKSYKIKLYNDSKLWKNQQVILLNKHPFDETRFRNKLCFDYIKLIPDMVSLRTQFVHLHVKDLKTSKEFVDYGLYTAVEKPNRRFLRSHGLDPTGNLYKAESFEFYKYPQALKLKNDPEYNQNNFEKYLEIKGSDDHHELIKMLKDVNDLKRDINTVIKEHFNRENYLTWLATNILLNNIDTNSQNFLLYRPTNSKKFYFLPWDFDGSTGAGDYKNYYSPWQRGISNYWGSVLHKRFLKDSQNLKDLNKKVLQIAKIITPKKTNEFLSSYFLQTNKIILSMPDLYYLGVTPVKYEEELRRVVDRSQKAYKDFIASQDKPMPIFLYEVKSNNINYAKNIFSWGESYDFKGRTLTYNFELSKNPDFKTILVQEQNIKETKIEIPKLQGGTYYWRVKIINESGKTQIPFDAFVDQEGKKYFGVKEIKIEEG